jgi:hypothetical protein
MLDVAPPMTPPVSQTRCHPNRQDEPLQAIPRCILHPRTSPKISRKQLTHSAANANGFYRTAEAGVAIASTGLVHAGGFATPQAIAAGVGPALLLAGVISALGAATALRVRARPRVTLGARAQVPAS